MDLVCYKEHLHCEYLLWPLVHVLSAEIYLLHFELHQTVFFVVDISELYLAHCKFKYFSFGKMVVWGLWLRSFFFVWFLVYYLVVFHQFMNCLELFAFFVEIGWPLWELFFTLGANVPNLVLIYQLYLLVLLVDLVCQQHWFCIFHVKFSIFFQLFSVIVKVEVLSWQNSMIDFPTH